MSGDQVCSFTPRNFEDTEAADQETEYVNTVILERNPGFSIIYNWLHDGLLQKNGYVKVYWEESEDVTEEPYRGVTDEELLMLAQNPEVEIVEHEAYNDGIGTAHNIRLRITKQLGKVKLVNLPPEEVLVDDNHREVSLLNANFVQHRRMVTISELREMGYEVDDDIGDYETDDSVEHAVRSLYQEESYRDNFEPAMRRVMYRETYIRTTEGAEGNIAQLRKVCLVGKEILHDEPCEIIPIACWTPHPMPHRHVGQSEADVVADLQVIKTSQLRNAIDAQALSIHGRWGIDVNKVNLEDMLTSRPGGLVDRKSTRLNSSHTDISRMPSSA